jgi:hypothetical protein
MEIVVREIGAADRTIWAEMRTALWPDETLLSHAKAVDDLLTDGEVWGFIAEAAGANCERAGHRAHTGDLPL